ncbi:MAG: MBL fold metallo-hydrolase [Desulfitobacterium sp.]|nr:MBL fold metallo-hydrolase [Desulfitobacterium sp.]
MNLKEIAPDIYCLRMPIDVGEPDINMYIFDGEVPTIIDVGINTPEIYEGIQKALKEIGIKGIKQVLLTHWHVDHGGCAERLRQDGAEIFIGKKDYEEWVSFIEGESFEVFEKLAGKVWGVPDKELAAIMKYNKKLLYVTELPKKVQIIPIGATIKAGNTSLRALYTPGHTSGHMSFLEEEKSLLFSGDFLLPEIIPYPGAWLENDQVVSGLPSFLEALNRIEMLEPKEYFPAHGRSRRSPASRSQEMKNQIQRQIQNFTPRSTVYEGALEMSKGEFHPVITFVNLHYVYGWQTLMAHV